MTRPRTPDSLEPAGVPSPPQPPNTIAATHATLTISVPLGILRSFLRSG